MNERDKELAEQAGIAVWGDAVYMYDPKDTLDSTVMEKFADLVRADERDIIFNLVQKIAARFYKDDAEKAFEELTEAIQERGNT
jgi:hypothetical protein